MSKANVLVVGAGPTGLTASLELARRGVSCRVIERRDAPSPLSRAVGIMPNTMRLLEPSGAAAKIKEKAIKVAGVELFLDNKKYLIYLWTSTQTLVLAYCACPKMKLKLHSLNKRLNSVFLLNTVPIWKR